MAGRAAAEGLDRWQRAWSWPPVVALAKPWLEHGLEIGCQRCSWRGQPRSALVVCFSQPREAVSWALWGGGFQRDVGTFVCCQVKNADLAAQTDPEELFEQRLAALSPRRDRLGTVGMMTSAEVADFCWGSACEAGVSAWALATVGLSNALRVGAGGSSSDGFVGARPGLGTINLACWVSLPLSPNAQLETLSIATQARTLEMLEAAVPCSMSDGWASGTGTDCVAVFSPPASGMVVEGERYAGMHTKVGRVVGRATRQAIARGIAAWRARCGAGRA